MTAWTSGPMQGGSQSGEGATALTTHLSAFLYLTGPEMEQEEEPEMSDMYGPSVISTS